MRDETSGRDVRIGDLGAVEVARTQREPRLDAEATIAVPRLATAAVQGRAVHSRRDYLLWGLAALAVVLLATAVVQQLRQARMEQALSALEQRAAASVQTLETRVSDTRSTLATADDAVRGELDGLAAQIKRQRDELARLQATVSQQERSLDALAKSGGKLSGDVAALVQADAAIDARFRTLADGVDALQADIARQGQTLQRVAQEADIQRLRGEVAVLGSSLRELVAEQDRRLRASEQAMASVDAFRRQVNQTLDQHTRQIGVLSTPR